MVKVVAQAKGMLAQMAKAKMSLLSKYQKTSTDILLFEDLALPNLEKNQVNKITGMENAPLWLPKRGSHPTSRLFAHCNSHLLAEPQWRQVESAI